MLEIAQFTSASSLSNLHSFVSLINLNKLTKVGRCFWNECHATHAGQDDEAGTLTNDDAVPTLVFEELAETYGAYSEQVEALMSLVIGCTLAL
ncbi:hypothetical protein INT45_009577 [Circinella minor]|uniref:Uncharacterized protein n=1 Tax=Circinella minor TaxID=1195481 RepID=A0A8H7VHN6_9FUNG|nr:hypothetical protein INT45_009577 [Circinella minor]